MKNKNKRRENERVRLVVATFGNAPLLWFLVNTLYHGGAELTSVQMWAARQVSLVLTKMGFSIPMDTNDIWRKKRA